MSSKKDNKSQNQPDRKPEGDKKKSFLNPGGGPKKPSGDENNWARYSRVIMTWLIVVMLAFVAMQFFADPKPEIPTITFMQYRMLLNAEVQDVDGTEVKIVKAVVYKSNLNDYDFEGKLNQTVPLQTTDEKIVDASSFMVTLGALDSEIQNEWIAKGIEVTFEEKDSMWTQTLIGFLPWILIIGLWLFFMRRMQGGGAGGSKGLFSFGKSKAKMISKNTIQVTFSDVAGADEAKYELQEVIEFLKEPGKFQRLGGKIPRGVLLLGPPGTGKTLLARAVAGEAEVPFFSISGAEFVEMFVGVGASRVRDLFENAKKNTPCIVFIDEIDAVGRQRGAGLGGGHDEREQTLNQLLVEMDGFEQGSTVIIIAATNRPDVLDPALLRPGRFDRQVVVDRPDVKGRLGILKVHTRNIPLDPDVDLATLAKSTPGLAGAELANLANEAALHAARLNMKTVSMTDFEEAKDKIMMGMERKSMIISEDEKRMTAFHEAGHVLVASKIPESDPIHKVTIIPRGRALGVTTSLPIDEKHTYSKPYLEAIIAYAMGGRAAEMLVFGQLTTGAGNDIERATQLARKMVCEWGMSDLGPLTFGAKQEEIFLGREISQHRDYSEETAITIDQAVRSIVSRQMERANEILKENREILDKLAEALLDREILDSEEINLVLNNEPLPPKKSLQNGENGNEKQEGEKQLKIDNERAEKIRKAVEEIRKQEEEKKARRRFMNDSTVTNSAAQEKVSYRFELMRKGIHMMSLSIPVLYYFISKDLMISILVPLMLAFIIPDLLRSFHEPSFRLYNRVFGRMLRTHEKTLEKKTLNGASWVLVAATLSVLLFPKIIAITAFAILIVSDTTAALVGRRFGTKKYRDKTLAGSLAFVFSAWIVVLFTPKVAALPAEYLIGFVASIFGALAEVFSFNIIDDNFSIPLAVGGVDVDSLYLVFARAECIYSGLLT